VLEVVIVRVLKKELWPHSIKIKELTDDDVYDIENWLGEKLGIFKGRWNVVYEYNHTDFYFKEQGDAVIFALKWA
jgi:hypothetical protein